jgi:hypothetical protein
MKRQTIRSSIIIRMNSKNTEKLSELSEALFILVKTTVKD